MHQAKTAVILAAGMGTRLREVLESDPKGLLEISGKRLIVESLKRLIKGGIREIILVTGYKGDNYKSALASEFPQIRFIPNLDYDSTGSMHSLFQVRNAVTSDFLLLESDLLYEDRAIPALLNSDRENEILISGKTESGDEVWVYGENDRVQRINKEKSDHLTCQGELVGISKLSLAFMEQLAEYYQENAASLRNAHYEECISDLAASYPVHYLKIEDLIWTEIDNPHHLERALQKIYPKLYNDSPANRRS